MAYARICKILTCDKPAQRGRYCGMHESRLRRRGSTDEPPKRDVLTTAIVGHRYGRLVGISEAEPVQGKTQKVRRFLFQCDCGAQKIIRANGVRSGAVKSCGCLHREVAATIAGRHCLTHGDCRVGRRAREYGLYRTMLSRCYDTKVERYSRYGGRGIVVCDRWRGDGGYENFLADMGRKPRGMSLDRIDPDGPYSPQNCRWATARQQANNTTRNRRLDHNGKTQTLAEWGREAGLRPLIIHLRLQAGWEVGDALTKPLRQNGQRQSCATLPETRRSASSEYGIWRQMIRRCHNPEARNFASYGGRGIEVCPEWRASFEAFLAHVGPRPSPELSLDRIDNDKGYHPGNVRWADRIMQSRNRRSVAVR